MGSAGNLPVKYNQSTALLRANSAEAPAKIKSTVSLFPQIVLTIKLFFTKPSIKKLFVTIYE
jgi:hypothetical protein